MLELLKNWKGEVEIDGKNYENIEACMSDFKTLSADSHIFLRSAQKKRNKSVINASESISVYRITVKKYMTQKATPSFDFMAKWNNDIPMPMRTMTGTVEKETPGMVYMKLHGQAYKTVTCMCCGRELTNPISRHYGIGPICMSKVGIQCDIDDIEGIREKLIDIEWSGWVIKSAIIEKVEV